MPPTLRTQLVVSILLLLLAVPLLQAQEQPANTQGAIFVLQIDGAIGPAVSAYIVQGIARAEEANAALVVLQIDTPGGLDRAMREIIKAITTSSVPVASFVAPAGARAASAGPHRFSLAGQHYQSPSQHQCQPMTRKRSRVPHHHCRERPWSARS